MKLPDLNILSIGNTIQLVGAVWQGEGKTIICVFPDEALDDKDDVNILRMDSAEWEVFIRQADVMETEVLSKAKDGSIIKTILRKSSRQVDQTISWKVFKRDGYKCRYCGNDNVPLTVDHLVRWEEGGPTIEANLISACKKCNRTRGNMSYDAWLDSEYYNRFTGNRTQEVSKQNALVLATLPSIPRKYNISSR
jgi:hypothetical protein